MKKVTCIDAKDFTAINKGESYKVAYENERSYFIDIYGCVVDYPKECFSDAPPTTYQSKYDGTSDAKEMIRLMNEKCKRTHAGYMNYYYRSDGIQYSVEIPNSPIITPAEMCRVLRGESIEKWEPKWGDEVEYNGKKARYVAKSSLANDNSIIIEIEMSKEYSRVEYCDPTHIRPILSTRDRVIEKLKEAGFSTYNYYLDVLTDSIIKIVKEGER